jgi:hypothetical protein
VADYVRWSREDLVQLEYELYSEMLDDAKRKRREDGTVVAADFLGVADTRSLAQLVQDVSVSDADAVRFLLMQQLEGIDPATLGGATPSEPVSWSTFGQGGEAVRVPNYASVPFPAGTVAKVALFVRCWPHNTGTLHVEVSARPEDQDAAQEYLDHLVSSARGDRSPYRHRVVEAAFEMGGVGLRLVDLERVTRHELVLSRSIWDAVHRNVDRMFERMERLAAAGLGTNRGLLLAGPPGTGKSALCRALALEYEGRVTTAIVSAASGQHILSQLYERVDPLGPAMVMIEDLDLLIGDRESKERFPLVQFLSALDGLMTHHSRVVTIATTNDAELVDVAALRAARFDQVVTLEPPDPEQRSQILEVYLRSLEHDVDVEELAARTDGFTGADLREVVRAAVLDSEDNRLGVEHLKRAIDRRRRTLTEARMIGFTRDTWG